MLARILYVALPDVAVPDRPAVILLEGEIHQQVVVDREPDRELALGQEELEQVQEQERVWAALIRITRNKELLPMDRQEEICRQP